MTRLLTLAFCFMAILCIPVLSMIAQAHPVAGAPVLVITPPWLDGGAVVAAAGGRLIGWEQAPLADLAHSERVDFATALAGAGAWLVLDGARISEICGIEI